MKLFLWLLFLASFPLFWLAWGTYWVFAALGLCVFSHVVLTIKETS